LLADLARRINPAARRAADRAAMTFSELCDLYMLEGVAHKKAATLRADRGRIKSASWCRGNGQRPAGLDVVDLRKVQDVIAAGEWAENVQSSDWVGHAVAKALDLDVNVKRDKERIRSLLRTWTANRALRVERRLNESKGRERPVVVVGNRA
jgi:hypothetical protein